jgi:hypothetical protein
MEAPGGGYLDWVVRIPGYGANQSCGIYLGEGSRACRGFSFSAMEKATVYRPLDRQYGCIGIEATLSHHDSKQVLSYPDPIISLALFQPQQLGVFTSRLSLLSRIPCKLLSEILKHKSWDRLMTSPLSTPFCRDSRYHPSLHHRMMSARKTVQRQRLGMYRNQGSIA